MFFQKTKTVFVDLENYKFSVWVKLLGKLQNSRRFSGGCFFYENSKDFHFHMVVNSNCTMNGSNVEERGSRCSDCVESYLKMLRIKRGVVKTGLNFELTFRSESFVQLKFICVVKRSTPKQRLRGHKLEMGTKNNAIHRSIRNSYELSLNTASHSSKQCRT